MFLYLALMTLAWHHQLAQYCLKLARGQAELLLQAMPLESYQKTYSPGPEELANLARVVRIKEYSVQELGFKPTPHYTRIYPDQGRELLWLVSASKPYAIEPYLWDFPLLGNLSYKGYFNKGDALLEVSRLQDAGYDVDLGKVSAWSSLGWWPDPLFERHLKLQEADFCALLFHELFHSTYYQPDQVNLNENLADFIAEKACFSFLKDSLALGRFQRKCQSRRILANFMLQQADSLNSFYPKIKDKHDAKQIKRKSLVRIMEQLSKLAGADSVQRERLREDISRHGNAAFVGYLQYHSLHDSLENAFNKFYAGRLKNLVRSLEED